MDRKTTGRGRRLSQKACMLLLVTGIWGCSDLFNPSFLDLVGGGTSTFEGIDAPSGNIALTFVNNAQIQDEVFRFLIQGQQVVTPDLVEEIQRFNPTRTDEEIAAFLQDILDDLPANFEEWNLPPRTRVTALVTTADGGVQRLEFLDGLRLVRGEELVGEAGNITSLPPELEQNDNKTYIAQCPITGILVLTVDVYRPVVMRILETEVGENFLTVLCTNFDAPQYEGLVEDQGFDPQTGLYTITRNFDPRLFPPPLDTINCGAVVVIELTGDLTLPFRDVSESCPPGINPASDGRAPAYFGDTQFGEEEMLAIPGRYGVSLQVRGN